MRLMALMSNKGSGEHVQTRQSLRRLHIESIDVAKDPDQNLDLAIYDVSISV